MTFSYHFSVCSLDRELNKVSEFRTKWKAEMMRRALANYYRQGGSDFPCPYLSRIVEHRKERYAYLANSRGTLAVYRIRSENSFYRRAMRWPRAIEEQPVSRRALAYYCALKRAGLVDHHSGTQSLPSNRTNLEKAQKKGVEANTVFAQEQIRAPASVVRGLRDAG
ncbi:hypothetical protein [Methylobacterium sp. CM6257]